MECMAPIPFSGSARIIQILHPRQNAMDGRSGQAGKAGGMGFWRKAIGRKPGKDTGKSSGNSLNGNMSAKLLR